MALEIALGISNAWKKYLVELILDSKVSSDRYQEKYDHCSDEKVSNGKTSRRRLKVDPGNWKMFPEEVKELPFNIDGTCVFRLAFQNDKE